MTDMNEAPPSANQLPGVVPVALAERLRRAERAAARSALASTFVHKLGTPLNVLLGRANMILASPDLDDRLSKNARVLVDTAQQMVDDLQELAATERAIRQDVGPVDLSELVRRSVRMFETVAAERDIAVELGELPAVACMLDAVHVLQLVTSKVALALAGRGGTLRVSTGREQVDQPADLRCSPGEFAFVRLRREGVDDGLQVSADAWQDREDVQIARMMGGFIACDRGADGATWSLYWPCRDPASTAG